MSTTITNNGQITVNSKAEAIGIFKRASFIDCKISAYPSRITNVVNSQKPDFIFIDIDKSTFKTEQELQLTLSNTLDNIKLRLGGHPTVLFTASGYHIYLPVQTIVLEEIDDFRRFFQTFSKLSKVC